MWNIYFQTHSGGVRHIDVDVTCFEGEAREAGAVQAERTRCMRERFFRFFFNGFLRLKYTFGIYRHAWEKQFCVPVSCLCMMSSMRSTTARLCWKSSSEMPCTFVTSSTTESSAFIWAGDGEGSARNSFSSCFSYRDTRYRPSRAGNVCDKAI